MNAVLAPRESNDGFPAPRPFQIKAHEALREGFRNGHRRQIIMAPTGAGKTYIGLKMAMGKDYVEALAAKKPVFIPKSETIASRVAAVNRAPQATQGVAGQSAFDDAAFERCRAAYCVGSIASGER